MIRVPREVLAAVRTVEAVLGRSPVAAVLSGSAVDGGLRPFDVTLVRWCDVVPWRYPPTRAFAYGEWLRREVEAACKGRLRGRMASPIRRV